MRLTIQPNGRDHPALLAVMVCEGDNSASILLRNKYVTSNYLFLKDLAFFPPKSLSLKDRGKGESNWLAKRPENRTVELRGYSFTFLSRSEFAITDTELKLIAAAARIGLNNSPKNG